LTEFPKHDNRQFLKKIPDVSRIPNLETLYLNGCTNLVEVHCSVGFLDKLVDLSLDCCYNLRIFPRSLKLRSLERLVIGGCSRLKNFPEIECQMERIEYVKFVVTGIEELEGLQVELLFLIFLGFNYVVNFFPSSN
jgi:hypothetical protein